MGMVKLTPCRLDAAVRIGRYTLMCAAHESSTYCTHRALAGAVFLGNSTTTNFKQGSASRQCRNASFDSGEMTSHLSSPDASIAAKVIPSVPGAPAFDRASA